ncbi:MAG TPA: dienelactone hydrolase family protein [Thermodesulfobacteriota bacterium]|nr:dienelactone hydrolase family protein [Thermodesulfobacteriota bacterium]
METQVQVVTVTGEGGPLEAYLVRPGLSGPRPGVLVVQEVFGLTSDLRRVCDRFARRGYVALAVNLYSGLSHPDPDTYQLEAARAVMAGLADRAILRALEGGVDFLRRDPQVVGPGGAPRVGAIGFCIGGALAMMLACSTDGLSAVVNCYGRVFYPGLSELKPRHPVEYVGDLRCPLLGLFGQEDDLIPPAHIERLRAALKAAEKEFELIVYPRAGHAFLNEDRPTYRPEVAREAWEAVDQFFARHLGG